MKRLLLTLGSLVGLVLIVVACFAINVLLGMRAEPQMTGTLQIAGLRAPVQILRDTRDVPHIRAQNEHDMFFAEGYVEGTDRLFQLDLLRRYVLGDLSEVFGAKALPADELARAVPVAAIVERQLARLSPSERSFLQAFSDGVNAAAAREPTPTEFRLLAYRPKPWRPEDSLVVGFATVLVLTDTWDKIADRSARIPVTDPCYEAPVTAGLAHLAPVTQACTVKRNLLGMIESAPAPIGSNEWAVGATHASTGRALLANDPHLRLGIPGVWYLVDLQAPEYHAAGATFAGTPGVILGHNDRIAWGATNGTVTGLSVFWAPVTLARKHDPTEWQTETFHVRLGPTVTQQFYRTPTLFSVRLAGNQLALVRWNAYFDPHSPLETFDQLDRARSVDDAIAALAQYPGPTQNFVVADTSGKASYNLAGKIPQDPVWSRAIHPERDLTQTYPPIPFAQLPHVAPSRNAIVWTANNKMYGAGYPYRLTAQFEPPYRAYRIAELLEARKVYDVAYFTKMQMDVLSLPEQELAKMIVRVRPAGVDHRALDAIAHWNGMLAPQSQGAAIVVAFRKSNPAPIMPELDYARHGMERGAGFAPYARSVLNRLLAADPALPTTPWGVAGATIVHHPLQSLGIAFLDGTIFPGDGDAFTVHVQNEGTSQSFRAVWDVGNWDAGGITIPQGESGWPGSPYYTDEAAAWVAGRLLPLPYSEAAVDRATVARLELDPAK